jgi:hypothetical protein
MADGSISNGSSTVNHSITKVSSLARDDTGKYIPARALDLLPEVLPILHVFLSGKMREADEQVKNGDPKAETLYYPLGMLSMLDNVR